MLMTYKEAVDRSGSAYKLAKAVEEQALYKQEDGIYSTNKYESELGIIMTKYPKAVLTGEYAFYCHGLTNVIPEKYDLATRNKAAKIRDARIRQIYMRDDLFSKGVSEKTIDGATVRIYDRERMLIELLRYKNKLSFDFYKEVLLNYRKIMGQLDIQKIQDYAMISPKSKMILNALQMEVF